MPWGIGNWLKDNAGLVLGYLTPGGPLKGLVWDAARGSGVGGAVRDYFQGPDALGEYAERLEGYADQFADPNYGLDYFQRLAASSGPAASDYYGFAQSRGGSGAQADQAFAASQRRAQTGAYDAFSQFRLGADQNAAGIYGQLAGMQYADATGRREGRQGFLNQVLGIGGTLLAGPVGGAVGYGLGNAQGGTQGGTPVPAWNPEWDQFSNPYGGYQGPMNMPPRNPYGY